MSDDLRTRIAKVLQQRWSGPTLWEEKDGAAQRMYLSDADAVIRELQLTVVGDGIIVGAIVGEQP